MWGLGLHAFQASCGSLQSSSSGRWPLQHPPYGRSKSGWLGYTIWGRSSSAVAITEGLAGPCQSTRRPLPGVFGGRRNDGVGVAGALGAPAGGAAGRLHGGPEIRPPFAGRLRPPASDAQHTTHSTRSHTQPSRFAFPMCRTSRPSPFDHSTHARTHSCPPPPPPLSPLPQFPVLPVPCR